MNPSSRPKRLLLISDLHLEEERPELTQAFLNFLQTQAQQASALYILGDFFNLWIGDDDDRPLNAAISSALKQEADKGLAIYLMHGNRDFLLGDKFAANAGASMLDSHHVLTFEQDSYLLLHGDELCTRDTDYLAFRSMVRNPQWQQDFLSKSLAERRAFADQARASSKSMNSNKADDIMDVSQDAVEQVLQEYGLHKMVHGHTHRPALHEFSQQGVASERIVLGDWGSLGWFVEITPAGCTLKRFNIPS